MNDNNDINQNYALINNPLENNNENNNNVNVIIDDVNQDGNIPDINELQNQLMNNDNGFFDKFSAQEVFDILNNFVPPSLYSLLIYFSFNKNGIYCDMNVYLILKTLLCVYLSYIFYSLFQSFLIYNNHSEKKPLKFSLMLIDALITTFYFFSIFISYLIYLKNDSKCFIEDNLVTVVFYALLFLGLVILCKKQLILVL